MIARSLAGVLLGFTLAAALLALPMTLLPDHGQAWVVPVLLLFFPLWIALMTVGYLCRSGRRAWLVLGTGNVLAFAALWSLRAAGL